FVVQRADRAQNDEAFDVIHLHEPLVPGPTVTALLLRLAPTVGTFHSAGESGAYRVLSKTARWGADHLSTRVAVSEAARELAHRYLGGGPSHGASTRTSWPSRRISRARPNTWAWTPPGIEMLYGLTIATRNMSTSYTVGGRTREMART
ncbi:MAG: glycosyltransferase, partial [Actinomycetota bacterium]